MEEFWAKQIPSAESVTYNITAICNGNNGGWAGQCHHFWFNKCRRL